MSGLWNMLFMWEKSNEKSHKKLKKHPKPGLAQAKTKPIRGRGEPPRDKPPKKDKDK